ncbi:hypothetical protein RB195_022935 [Necator americanus]|uniref:Uncharacterized protein n=1 Tax=Necator americanus TaxID=51031 RepID=A0ABR1EHG2_NECAM
MSDVSNSFSAWETLPEDEPPLCIAVRRPVSPPRHYEAIKNIESRINGHKYESKKKMLTIQCVVIKPSGLAVKAEKNSTIIFPFPIDLLSSFLHRPSVKPVNITFELSSRINTVRN